MNKKHWESVGNNEIRYQFLGGALHLYLKDKPDEIIVYNPSGENYRISLKETLK